MAPEDIVMIMGEFSNWLPEVMEKYDFAEVEQDNTLENTFFYRTRVLRGFKYRYNFCVQDELVIDDSQPVSTSKFG